MNSNYHDSLVKMQRDLLEENRKREQKQVDMSRTEGSLFDAQNENAKLTSLNTKLKFTLSRA